MAAIDRSARASSRVLALSLPALALLLLCLGACDAHREPPPVLEATTSREVQAGDDPTSVAPDALSTPAIGAHEPLVIVTMFTDYQCVNCRRMHDIAARLYDRWPDEVQVQFRQLPLQGHALARPSALAALAAHRQGRFTCMSSALIRSRLSWTNLDGGGFFAFVLRELVPRCDLDGERFMRDVADPRLAAKVDADRKLADDLKMARTPTVLVDGLDARLWPEAGKSPAMLLNSLVRRSLREARATLGLASACPAESDQRPCDIKDLPAQRIFGNTGDADLTMRLLDAD